MTGSQNLLVFRLNCTLVSQKELRLAYEKLRLACLRLAFSKGKGVTIYTLNVLNTAGGYRWRSGVEYRLPFGRPGIDSSWGHFFTLTASH